MKIKWFGHACFLLESRDGISVLTDPFDEKVGYELPKVRADIVTTSHSHYDHNHTAVVDGPFRQFQAAGDYSAGGIAIRGIETFHDEVFGAKRGKNTLFVFTIDGMKICHCGDLGHVLTPEQVDAAGVIDVLLVPVGGIYTVDARGAIKVMEQLRPKLTIPMHYKTEALKFELHSVDEFLKLAGNWRNAGKQEIEVNQSNIKDFPEVVVLHYSNE